MITVSAHEYRRDGKGYVEIALLLGVDIQRNGERGSRAGQAVNENVIDIVGKAGGEQQRCRFAQNAADGEDGSR